MPTTINYALTFDDVLLIPQYSEVLPTDVDTSTQLLTLKLKVPFISAPMDTVTEYNLALALALAGGLGIIHKNMPAAQQAGMIKKITNKNLPVGAAVGVTDDQFSRAQWCINDGAKVIAVDSAHGHSRNVLQQIKRLKKTFKDKILIIGGNVVTAAGTKALIATGANIVKVGVGPGSICTTRVVSGVGMPQLTAIMDCIKEAEKTKTPIIADGGLRYSGDIVKALAAGAAAIMSGNLFAGTAETPGKIEIINGKKMKVYRGMGSLEAMQKGSKDRYGQQKISSAKKLVPEGVCGYVPYRGPVREIIAQLAGGLRAGMGYCGAQNLPELTKKAKFVWITNAGWRESHPHTIQFGG